MNSLSPRRLWAALLTTALMAGLGLSAPTVAVAADGDRFTFTGHGWGHGRGMGQYGALGYAVDHGWGYGQILDHFYGGTTRGSVGDRQIAVELTALTGNELRAIGRGLVVNGVPRVDANADGRSVRVTRQADGSFRVEMGSTCAGPTWTSLGTFDSVTVATTSQAGVENFVRVCEAAGERAYRGSLSVQRHTGTGVQTTFNRVSAEGYLRGVVPRESPASWGSLGGGRGMEALKAQAVTARSYALSGSRPSGATTCDTTACQVYGGASYQPFGQARQSLEAASTNTAIAATAGEVRLRANGAVARTEFSSSTGGYSAGGEFPAVVDHGDDITLNPNHRWSTTQSGAVATFTPADVAARLGLAGVRSMVVTGRNGLGAEGGRVTQVTVVDGAGRAHTYSGNQVRVALNLKSDWFSISAFLRSEAQAVVKALYQDLLGRGVDPSGLATWTDRLMAGGSQSELVGDLTASDEYIRLRVAQAYREVLGREPEPAGAASWLAAIRAGHATVDDAQRRFYDSAEFQLRSGGTPEGLVARLYSTVLRRTASPAEVAYWATRVRSQGRGAVVDAIWFSLEAGKIRSGTYYQTFLKRTPDPAGLSHWATVLLVQGEGAVRQGIAGSTEYRQRAVARFP